MTGVLLSIEGYKKFNEERKSLEEALEAIREIPGMHSNITFWDGEKWCRTEDL